MTTVTATASAPLRDPGVTKRNFYKAIWAIAGLFAIITAWEIAARIFGVPMLFPSPGATFTRLGKLISSGSIFEDLSASLTRIIIGFLLGSLVGIALGLLAGSSRVLLGLLEPFLTFFRFVPPLAWFAPVLVWFGTGDSSKIVLIMYTSIFVVAVNTVAGVQAIPHNMIRMAGSYGIGFWMRFRFILLPASAPYVVAGMRVAMGNAFMTVVTAEMLGASAGLGVMLNNAMTLSDTVTVFATIIVLGVLGFGSDKLFVRFIERFGSKFRAVGDIER